MRAALGGRTTLILGLVVRRFRAISEKWPARARVAAMNAHLFDSIPSSVLTDHAARGHEVLEG
jgi:hypothetical protein